ncbi:MAG TPA: FecR family protein [Burkholderiales bacterium]|nr:FecR family protein [Burkholderiales bacterium]
MKTFKTSLLLTASLALGTVAHAEVVGRVLMAAGDTSVIRDSLELRVAVGFPVEGKDTLRTGSASNMQIRFTDESIVSMRDQSLLKIDEYQFTGKQDGLEKAFFNLLKGGFRTITGLIGRVNKTNYGVKTATATIGIRGTNFALLLCAAGSCGAAAKDGLYGGVSGGIIAATNNTGEYQFGSGDYFYAPTQDAPVKKLIGPPGFFADPLAGQSRGGIQQASSTGTGSEQVQNGGAGSDSRPNNVTPPPPQQSFVVTENKTSSGAPGVLPNIVATMLPTSGTAVQFPFVSGTVELPSGPIPLSSGGTLIVNFMLKQIGLNPATPITFSAGVVNYSMNSLSASYASPSNISGTLSGNCTNGACTTGSLASGTVNGQFTGTTGAGLGITLNAPLITSLAPAVALTAVKYSCPTC